MILKKPKKEIKRNADIDKAMESICEVGHLRNILVHSNFAAYSLDNKTADEIYELYRTALPFVNYIKGKLSQIT